MLPFIYSASNKIKTPKTAKNTPIREFKVVILITWARTVTVKLNGPLGFATNSSLDMFCWTYYNETFSYLFSIPSMSKYEVQFVVSIIISTSCPAGLSFATVKL
jgi:hypothetical protein